MKRSDATGANENLEESGSADHRWVVDVKTGGSCRGKIEKRRAMGGRGP